MWISVFSSAAVLRKYSDSLDSMAFLAACIRLLASIDAEHFSQFDLEFVQGSDLLHRAQTPFR